jgi:hypothetical protein
MAGGGSTVFLSATALAAPGHIQEKRDQINTGDVRFT